MIIQNALHRYKYEIIFGSGVGVNTKQSYQEERSFIGEEPAPGLSQLNEVNVEITDGIKANCGYPQHNEDESYSIEISSSDHGQITSKTVWGALRGLETFSQLVYTVDNYNGPQQKYHLLINETTIYDHPRFPYRGLLLDTARHYLPVHIILANIDAMAYNKLNTFHWHLIDDQSFPYVSKHYPDIHLHGSYTPNAIYTPEDVQEVIEYARMRGIRVIPELDTPGHTHAMARAYPNLLTPCYGGSPPRPLQPDYPNHSEREVLNPMRNETYEFLKELYSEFKQTFPDQYIHLGMDEVFYSCWRSNPEIKAFMQENDMHDYHEVEEYYARRTLENVKSVGYKYIIWQDPVDNGVIV